MKDIEIGSEEQAIYDIDEIHSGFCNSLNALWSYCKHLAADGKYKGNDYCEIKTVSLDNIGDMLLRAQTVITYLKYNK